MQLFGTPRILRKIAPRGLLGRSLLILVTPLVIVQLVTAEFFFDRHWETVMRRLALGIAGDVATIIELMERFPDDEDRNWIFGLAQGRMELTMRFEVGEVLPNVPQASAASSEDQGSLEQSLGPAVRERVNRPVEVDAGLLSRDVEIRVQLANGVLHVTAPRKRLYSSTAYIFVFWMVGTALIVFGIATVFMSNQVRSIRRLAAGAEGFGKGRDLPPLKLEGAREVRQAALAFNIMRERIQRQIAQRTEMLAGVSHDLRTPITRMKLQLAMMPETEDAKALAEDVAEMEAMVEGYLAFARGEGTEVAEIADLGDIVEGVVAKFVRSGATVSMQNPDAVVVRLSLRRSAIERCLTNLIGNGVRYGGVVRVTLAWIEATDEAEILVEDNGPGIPAAQREDVFRAFFRGEPSRNVKTGGIGLGLTIARDVARVHGGDITLHDSKDLGGLKVRLRLPM